MIDELGLKLGLQADDFSSVEEQSSVSVQAFTTEFLTSVFNLNILICG